MGVANLRHPDAPTTFGALQSVDDTSRIARWHVQVHERKTILRSAKLFQHCATRFYSSERKSSQPRTGNAADLKLHLSPTR
jgi:hypothetical protein